MSSRTTILSQYQIEELKGMLRHGDIARIAKALGLSRATVYRCLVGNHEDRHGILKYALKLLQDRRKIELEVIAMVKQSEPD